MTQKANIYEAKSQLSKLIAATETGSGSMIALCPDESAGVQQAFEAAGYKAIPITLG